MATTAELKLRLRRRLQDLPDRLDSLNNLPQLGEEEIEAALTDGLEDLNTTLPATSYTVETCPYVSYLLDFATIRAIDTLILYLNTNAISHSDGGDTIDERQSIQVLMAYRGQILSRAEQKLSQTKIAAKLNANLASRQGFNVQY